MVVDGICVEGRMEKNSQKVRKMGSTILDCFTKLAKEIQGERVNAGVVLLRYLSQQNSDQTESKELDYALKRLIRGLGSSREHAKKGFYIALTSFLSLNFEIQANRILELIQSELHPIGSNSKSENADIYMGQILACGALIRSKVLLRSTAEEQQKILEYLIHAGKQRSYLSFVSTSFVVDLINELEEISFVSIIWPLLQKELGKAWPEQTLDTFYILLVITERFPSVIKSKFLKNHLGSSDVIDSESIKNLLKLLTDLPRIVCYRHPVYKIFCEKLTSTKYILEFWTGIDHYFVKPSKSNEHVGIEILKLILTNIKDKTLIPSLLTQNFLQHMLKRFSSCRKNKNDDIAISFRELLVLLVTVTSNEDIKSKTQIAVLKKLLLYPGDLMFEKITGTKVIHAITANLNAEGVKKLSKLYREVAASVNSREKQNGITEPWTNVERAYAAQLLTRLMGHPKIMSDHDWRLEQLKFLFNLAFCKSSIVGAELASQFKESFYRAMDHKLPKLSDLRFVLSSLVHYLNSEILLNDTIKLKVPPSEAALETWKESINLIERLEKEPESEKAVPIFHTMDLHMALQLFSDSEMAVSSIKELHSCFERLKKKKSRKTKVVENGENKEPEWVEVVVDLLLSLLSRNSHLLRSLVGCVFPHICPHLKATSIHQILEVLDVRNDKNPLSSKDDDNEEEDDDDDDDEEDELSDAESISDSNSEKEDEDNDETDTDSDKELTEDENDTVTDRLRLAVRQALGDASVQTDDEDIDVDRIDENEGKLLDESLAAAFRILRESRQTKSKRQGKSAEILTHFRVRVIDLLDTYLESCPSMALALDMLVPLFTLLAYCIKDPHQKPLENRVRACLKKLSAVKKFKNTEGVDEQLLTVILKALIEKGERSASVCQEMGDKLAECCTFLVRCVQQTTLPNAAIVQIYGENLTAFFKQRDCVLPATLFKSILQLCWDGNWQFAPLLVDFAFDSTIRSFRRGQAIEFLTIFYRNDRLIRSDNVQYINVRLKMEKKLCSNTINLLQELTSAKKVENEKSTLNKNIKCGKDVKQKFICLLLTLLYTVRVQHLQQAWNWQAIADAITAYRACVSLAKDAKSAYNKLAAQIGVPLNVSVKNEKIITANGQQMKNDIEDVETASEDESHEHLDSVSKNTSKESKKRQKNKSKQKDKQKLKKEARELRAKVMSEGLESCNFSSVLLTNGNAVDSVDNTSIQNGITRDVEVITNGPQKRPSLDAVEHPRKSKKRKNEIK